MFGRPGWAEFAEPIVRITELLPMVQSNLPDAAGTLETGRLDNFVYFKTQA